MTPQGVDGTDGADPRDARLSVPRVELDGPVPFSQSALWQAQHRYYSQVAVSAWSAGVVPHYITSNPFIAASYAELISAYARDIADQISPTDPLTILELGAGPGRLAYHLVRQLQADRVAAGEVIFPFRYVLSDFSEANIEYWLHHPRLQPLFDAGLMDVAHFDVTSSTELALRVSGETISTASAPAPLMVVANYVFDSAPLDVFANDGDALGAVLATWTIPESLIDVDDPRTRFENSTIRWMPRQIEQPYYKDPEWDRLLGTCRAMYPDGVFTLPTATMGCLDRLRALSGDNLVLLASDTAVAHLEEHDPRFLPQIKTAGAIYTMVNFHALACYVEQLGGRSFSRAAPVSSLRTSAFVFDGEQRSTPAFAQAYSATIGRVSPDDYFSVRTVMDRARETFDLVDIMAYLHLSSFDIKVLLECAPKLLEEIPELTEFGAASLRDAILTAVDLYFPIGEEIDAYHVAGSLLATLHEYEHALACFEQSRVWHGACDENDVAIANCHARLGTAAPPS